jgi:uncharacterized membrane protein
VLPEPVTLALLFAGVVTAIGYTFIYQSNFATSQHQALFGCSPAY